MGFFPKKGGFGPPKSVLTPQKWSFGPQGPTYQTRETPQDTVLMAGVRTRAVREPPGCAGSRRTSPRSICRMGGSEGVSGGIQERAQRGSEGSRKGLQGGPDDWGGGIQRALGGIQGVLGEIQGIWVGLEGSWWDQRGLGGVSGESRRPGGTQVGSEVSRKGLRGIQEGSWRDQRALGGVSGKIWRDLSSLGGDPGGLDRIGGISVG